MGFRMRLLEEEIDELNKLDELRIRSAQLRDDGKRALRNFEHSDWIEAKDPIEKALICRVLSYDPEEPANTAKFIKDLEKLTPQDIYKEDSDRVPVLRAARAMQALVKAPASAFSPATVFCLYQLIRELYSPDPPDWLVGAARAGNEAPSCAFVTSECARAILHLQRNLTRTATFLRGIQTIKAEIGRAAKVEALQAWNEQELLRLKTHFFVVLKQFANSIALKIEPPIHELDFSDIDEFLNNIGDIFEEAIKTSIDSIKSSYRELDAFRKEERNLKPHIHQSTMQGHVTATKAIAAIYLEIRRAQKILAHAEDQAEGLGVLATMCDKGARRLTSLLEPSKRYLGSVLDRELAAASAQSNLAWDPSELAFAATSYGVLTGLWDDDRLVRAAAFLSKRLSVRGTFPIGKAFMIDRKGYALHPVTAETIRAFSQLLRNVSLASLTSSSARSLLAFFEDTSINLSSTQNAVGWGYHHNTRQQRPVLWLTALSVIALAEINKMLDTRINETVFRHFTVQRYDKSYIREKALNLEDLFYPDYGLKFAPGTLKRAESIAVTLERMHAHVVGLEPLKKTWQPVYSLVLHGPPGTGKTTLVEALAASARVPLVEVTPSDIAIGGAEAIERRSRAVFRALSLLTGTVVLLDEFEQVLQRRSINEKRSLFTFLTPGTLPKIKNLNKQARRRRVAFVLITNLIGNIENAAIRDGRFDLKRGVYPPDPLSRAGQLLSQVQKLNLREGVSNISIVGLSVIFANLLKVVSSTDGLSMPKLARPSWFVGPSSVEAIGPGSPFALIHNNGPVDMSKARRLQPKNVTGEGDDAELEFQQWQWITEWDQAIKECTDLPAALAAYSDIPPEPKNPSEPKKTNAEVEC